MTSAEDQFRGAAEAASPITAAVANRIYPYVAPPRTPPPLIVYERTATEYFSTISSGQPAASRVTISAACWAKSRDEAKALGDALIAAMPAAITTTNRFGHYDEEADARADVVEFEVWELGDTSGGP